MIDVATGSSLPWIPISASGNFIGMAGLPGGVIFRPRSHFSPLSPAWFGRERRLALLHAMGGFFDMSRAELHSP